MKAKLFIAAFSSLFAVFLISGTGCTFENEEDYYAGIQCDTANVTYSATVRPIIQNACYACHSAGTANTAGAGIDLEGYAALKAFITDNSGLLIGSIRHVVGFSPMPKSAPKLSECDIRKIELWIIQGALDN